MKLIFAIVNNDDSYTVANSLTAGGYSVTKLSTSGGFLKAGNTTFIVGTDDEKVQGAIEIIKTHSSRRTKVVQTMADFMGGEGASGAVEVAVGGATIFVTDVEHFEKC